MFDLGEATPKEKPKRIHVGYAKVKFILQNKAKGLQWLMLQTGLRKSQVLGVMFEERPLHVIDKVKAELRRTRGT